MKLMRRIVEKAFPGTREARQALESAHADDEHVDELVRDLRRLQRENHFSQALARTLGER